MPGQRMQGGADAQQEEAAKNHVDVYPNSRCARPPCAAAYRVLQRHQAMPPHDSIRRLTRSAHKATRSRAGLQTVIWHAHLPRLCPDDNSLRLAIAARLRRCARTRLAVDRASLAVRDAGRCRRAVAAGAACVSRCGVVARRRRRRRAPGRRMPPERRAGVVSPPSWSSTPLPPLSPSVAGTRSRMSIGCSP